MAEIHCPYCYDRNISKIVYAKKGINKRKKQDYNLSDNEIIMPKRRFEKIDFDGELVTTHKLYNKYCNDCGASFNTSQNMATVDIKRINLILGSDTYRKRYIFGFYTDSPTYSFKQDYLTIKKGILDSNDVISILKAIKDNKTNLWNGYYGNHKNNNYWIFKIEYYNGLSDYKSGNGTYPDNWHNFITNFNEIIDKYNLY